LYLFEKIAEMFTPKIRTERIERKRKKRSNNKDTHGFGFRLEIRSRDDINHKIEAKKSLRKLAPG